MPDAETWDITSSAGKPYRIFVSRPEGDPPAGGFPVLYVLDGNAFFAGFAESRWTQNIMDASLGRTMIVAVGYPLDDNKPYAFERRMEDFTPPWASPMPPSERPFAKWAAGGWEPFYKFLVDDLRPAVASRYHIDPNRQSLFGHSLGGLFALHVLYKHPESFFAIVAASPSIYWNGASILAEEREFASHLANAPPKSPIARLLMVVGSREETRLEQMDAEDLAKRLEPLSAYGLRSRFQVYEGEPHLGVPTRAITDTMRFVFTWP
ncbi:MAG: alpha/beta hydrolase [Proteobacteria bacterium]|nr:alpha/beta hydrolase [Pseudomonadota bacterium]